jgi:GNAT superfamily N-acetyltransferase
MIEDDMNITLKPLLSTHQEFLWEMLYQALFVPPGHRPFPKDCLQHPDISKYASNWGKTHDRGLIAVEAHTQKPVGAAWLRLFTQEQKGYGYVDDDTPELSIAVLPSYRGKGIGSLLLQGLFHEARTHYTALSLSVSTANPAKRFYERFGFSTGSKTEHSCVMIKRLKEPDNLTRSPENLSVTT